MPGANRAVIITGASGGIGNVIAREFSARGWCVVPVDLVASRDGSETIVECDLVGFVRDLNYREDCLAKIRSLLPDDLERLVLVNNAAIQKLAPASQLTLSDWDDSLTVNLLAPFFLSQSLLPDLRAANGRIINIGSIHGKLTKPEFSAYATSKGALGNLTRSLAIEWAEFGVTVNAICPAAIDTPMLREGFLGRENALTELADYHPTKKIGDPRDVAQVVSMLAEYDGGFLTGALLDLTGGISSVLHDPA